MPSGITFDIEAVDKASATIDKVSGSIKGMTKESMSLAPGLENAGKSVQNFLSDNAMLVGGVTAVVGAVIAFGKAAVDAYGQAEVVTAQVNAVIQSTGGVAGMTAQSIDELANSLASMSGVDDETIKRGEALMLTFTNVGKNVFPQATEAALNMSMAMGTDLQSSIIQIGKALQSPVDGVTALQRVGVRLTDTQKAQVASFMAVNDIASAQGIILKELQTEFGGTADAMGNTAVGATNKLKVAWENLLEVIGRDISPSSTRFEQMATTMLNSATAMADKGFGYGEGKLNAFSLAMDFVTQRVAIGNQAIREAAGAAMENGDAWYNEAKAVDTATAANEAVVVSIADTTKANQSHISLLQRVQNMTTDYNKNLAETITKYGEASAEVKNLQADHQQAMNQIVYELYLARLGVDGFTDAERQMAERAGVSMGIFTQSTIDMVNSLEATSGALANTSTAADVAGDSVGSLRVSWASASAAADATRNTVDKLNSSVRGLPSRTDLTVAGHFTGFPDGFWTGFLCFTGDTEILLSNGTHRQIRNMRVGDLVTSYDIEQKNYIVSRVAQVFKHEAPGIIIINEIETTPEHPFFVNGDWKRAGEIVLGDSLLLEDETRMIVDEISVTVNPTIVYNIETDNETHNYFAGGVLVHNKTKELADTSTTTMNVSGSGAGGVSSPYVAQQGAPVIDYDRMTKAFTDAIRNSQMVK